MSPAVRNLLLNAPFNPYRLPGIAARYSLEGSPSDSTYLIDGSNRIMLVADRSGQSAVNGFVMVRSAGNYTESADSAALSITGDIDIRCDMAASAWKPSADMGIISKYEATGSASYMLRLEATSGNLRLFWIQSDGTAINKTSTAAPTVSDYGRIWVRATLDVDNGASGNDVKFWTSPDGVTWSQLGSTVTTAGITNIRDGTSTFRIGTNSTDVFAGTIYRAQVYNGIAGTLAFDANFTSVAKLAGSFNESSSNGASVSIFTTGATGARICGARDLYQGTQANQPIFSVSGGYNIATFDGSNDYLKAAPFSLSQPTSVYFTGSHVTWTGGDNLWDGGTQNAGHAQQDSSSPNIRLFAGSSSGLLSVPLATPVVLAAIFNGTAGAFRYNLSTGLVGVNVGTSAMNGFTLGAQAIAAGYGNITFSEVLIRTAADARGTQNRVASYMMKKWGVS